MTLADYYARSPPRWGGDMSDANPDWPHRTPDLLAFEALVKLFGQDPSTMLPKTGQRITIRCQHRRHPLGSVWATPEGPLLGAMYDSGRKTRKLGEEVLPTIKYRDVRPFLLRGTLTGSSMRCSCSEVEVTPELRANLAEHCDRLWACVYPAKILLG